MVLRFEPDVEYACWFSDDDSDWGRLCSIGPSGFDRYLQVLHPRVDGQDEPVEGDLDDTALLPLLDVLERHTATPQDCVFGLWDGYGEVKGGSAVAMLYTTRRPRWWDRWSQPPAQPVSPAFPAEVVHGPRVRIPARDYLLFRGSLQEAGKWGARLPAWRARINSPNLMWPADHAWFVATEIDNTWTGIGASPALAADLLEHPDLDVRRLDPTTWPPDY